jgi:hypothetical protein
VPVDRANPRPLLAHQDPEIARLHGDDTGCRYPMNRTPPWRLTLPYGAPTCAVALPERSNGLARNLDRATAG